MWYLKFIFMFDIFFKSLRRFYELFLLLHRQLEFCCCHLGVFLVILDFFYFVI